MNKLVTALRLWLNAGLGLVYPEVCQICRASRATSEQAFICSSCRSQVRYIERPFCERCGLPFAGAISTSFECRNCRDMDLSFETARSAVAAKDTVLEVIHRYKYHRAVWFEPFLAELLVQRARAELNPLDWDWIVPVPLHPTKQREREFNQAERLAASLGAATGIPLRKKMLRRHLVTKTQTWLTREERLENVHKAFSLRQREGLTDGRIVLVDDVFTTGATTNACARVLKEAGAARVCVWTVARGI